MGADGVAQKTIDFDGKRERGERDTGKHHNPKCGCRLREATYGFHGGW